MEIIALSTNNEPGFSAAEPSSFGGVKNSSASADNKSYDKVFIYGNLHDVAYFDYDLSSVPDDVKITRVYFRVKIRAEKTNLKSTTLRIQPKNDNKTVLFKKSIVPTKTATIYTIDYEFTEPPTKEELYNLALDIQFYDGITSQTNAYIYGNDMTIVYSLGPPMNLGEVQVEKMTLGETNTSSLYIGNEKLH